MSEPEYKLIGSLTSPFVRRIRLLLDGLDHEFVPINYFEKKDADYLRGLGPINKIPLLYHHGQVIYDSRIMFNYLNRRHMHWEMGVDEENLLSVIDAGLDAQVNLFMLKRSGLPVDDDVFYFTRQRERVADILSYLERIIAHPAFHKWEYPSMALYTWLDWASFRQLIPLEGRLGLLSFLERHEGRKALPETSPRLA